MHSPCTADPSTQAERARSEKRQAAKTKGFIPSPCVRPRFRISAHRCAGARDRPTPCILPPLVGGGLGKGAAHGSAPNNQPYAGIGRRHCRVVRAYRRETPPPPPAHKGRGNMRSRFICTAFYSTTSMTHGP